MMSVQPLTPGRRRQTTGEAASGALMSLRTFALWRMAESDVRPLAKLE
jgi:hypothetical protein